jgi:hypothetical protein
MSGTRTGAYYLVRADMCRHEPIKRALTPQLAVGLASVYKISPLPYGAAELSRQGEHSP